MASKVLFLAVLLSSLLSLPGVAVSSQLPSVVKTELVDKVNAGQTRLFSFYGYPSKEGTDFISLGTYRSGYLLLQDSLCAIRLKTVARQLSLRKLFFHFFQKKTLPNGSEDFHSSLFIG